MKKVFAVILTFMVTSSLLTVQVIAQSTFQMGIKTGLNFSNVYGDNIRLTDGNIGFVIGGFVSFDINEKVSIQPEVLFTMKGYDVTRDDFLTAKDNARINYLEIPVLLNVALVRRKTVGFEVFAGPAIAIKVSGNAETETFVVASQPFPPEIIKSFDLGLALGSRLNLGIIFIEQRFTIGLRNIDDDPATFGKLRNKVFSVLVGFNFKAID